MNNLNETPENVIASLDPTIETEQLERIYSKFHQENRKIGEIIKESDKECKDLSQQIEEEKILLSDLETELKRRREDKPAEKIASEKYALGKRISKLETDVQEILSERNRLLQELQKPDLDQDEIQPDVSLSKLALYRYLGLSGLKDDSDNFSILEIAPPGANKVHTILVDELKTLASQSDTTKTNCFWDLLP